MKKNWYLDYGAHNSPQQTPPSRNLVYLYYAFPRIRHIERRNSTFRPPVLEFELIPYVKSAKPLRNSGKPRRLY